MDFLDIANAVYYNVGGKIELSEEAKKVNSLLKNKNKTVFILIDGMGALVLKNLLPESFLNQNVKEVATTIFPTTTSVVLTTLATGLYPTTHAVNGWFSYIEETDESIVSLPFLNRFNVKQELKVKLEDIFYCNARMKEIPYKVSMIAKTDILKSEFSIWSRGNREAYGYRTIKGAFQTLSKLLNRDDEKEYIYLYIDDFDTACHRYGPDSEEARNLLNKIDGFVQKYARNFSGKVNTVITADHGQVGIKAEDFFIVNSGDKMIELLKAPPSGDSRFVCFHTKPGKEEEFQKLFNERYGNYAKLMSIEEIDKKNILGPEPMCEKAKLRFGNFCALFDKTHAFTYVKENIDMKRLKKGCHSGNSDEELKIPLIVI